jgi:hypothetical protein
LQLEPPCHIDGHSTLANFTALWPTRNSACRHLEVWRSRTGWPDDARQGGQGHIWREISPALLTRQRDLGRVLKGRFRAAGAPT